MKIYVKNYTSINVKVLILKLPFTEAQIYYN